MHNFSCFVEENILDLAIVVRNKFEVGRITNLGSGQQAEEQVPEKNQIGFISPKRRSEEMHKLDKIGFAPSIEDKEIEEESTKE